MIIFFARISKLQFVYSFLFILLCADKLCLSPNYFSDLLKKETGSTALHFIHDKSIEIAKTELASTDDTVNEIAYNLGFQYPQHFTRLFKKEVGYTPNEYRAQVS